MVPLSLIEVWYDYRLKEYESKYKLSGNTVCDKHVWHFGDEMPIFWGET